MNIDNQAGELSRAAARLLEKLKEKRLKIAFAESMSGGLLSGSMVRIPGASSVLLGSIVCYDHASKSRLLGVSEDLLREKGAETEEVTRAMAIGTRLLFPEADIILAISGSASAPVNEYQIASPPGSVFICFGFKNMKTNCLHVELSGSREEVINQSILLAFSCLNDLLC